MTTPNLSLPELIANQTQPHVPLNTALRRLDAIVQCTCIAQQDDPPTGSPGPVDGERYLVGPAPTGDWVGHEDDIAVYVGTAWQFFTPEIGWLVFLQSNSPPSLMIYGTESPAGWDMQVTGLGYVTPLTTEGDLSYHDGVMDTRLPVGVSGLALVVDDGEPGKLKWAGVGIPQNLQADDYTIALTDNGRHIHHASGSSSGDTYTLPANGTLALPLGFTVTITNLDTNPLSIAITTDVMYWSPTGATGTRTLAQYGMCTIMKVDSTHWMIAGSGLT